MAFIQLEFNGDSAMQLARFINTDGKKWRYLARLSVVEGQDESRHLYISVRIYHELEKYLRYGSNELIIPAWLMPFHPDTCKVDNGGYALPRWANIYPIRVDYDRGVYVIVSDDY